VAGPAAAEAPADGQGVPNGITALAVAGFKSIHREQRLDIRPLTILAGANSSGKSSIMQPLLLLKQTLDASYDPGPLLLDGPNVRFTSVRQVLARSRKGAAEEFRAAVGAVEDGEKREVEVGFGPNVAGQGFTLLHTVISRRGTRLLLRPGPITRQDIAAFEPRWSTILDLTTDTKFVAIADRCFLVPELWQGNASKSFRGFGEAVVPMCARWIQETIHVPGLRGHPQRTYDIAAVGQRFAGTFERYVASVIFRWKSGRDDLALHRLAEHLSLLGLTWTVDAAPVSDTAVEVLVGRLPRAARGSAHDLVSLADVGLGVSQVLPVLVALLAARPGQLVYLEQPELHLHPRAQFHLAGVLAEAAGRGVRVVAETHSAVLLRSIQTLVASGGLAPDLVRLHWFRRGADGATKVSSAAMDQTGAFGDWPEDFDEVAVDTERAYLDAVEQAQRNRMPRAGDNGD